MSFEYAPAPESRAVVSIKPKYGHFIGGKFVAGSKHFPTINPATEEVLSQIALAGKAEVDAAVKAARKAYVSTWSKMSGKERGKYLYRIARIMQERAREFAVLETLDNGKPIRESRDTDIPLAAAHFFYHAGWADKLEYAGLGTSPKPLGVAGQIIPWNFPLLMLAWKVAPALAAGNTVVLKPAESTSLTALLFAEVCQQAELPAGVVNIVTGDGSTGALIVNHPGIDKIAFTGSTEVGKIIARAVAPTKKSVCCAGSRLLLQENVAEEVLHKLKNRMEKIRVGDPMDKNTDVGAINSKEQLTKITELAAAGDAEGAERWSPACNLPAKGFWFAPTIFTGVTQAHRIAREEIFGPVLSVLTFRTPQEAIEKANNTPFGLSAGIWSEKGSRTLWASQQLRAGVIWANTFNKFDPTSPFGGYKESGWGREGGRHGLSAYLKGVSHE